PARGRWPPAGSGWAAAGCSSDDLREDLGQGTVVGAEADHRAALDGLAQHTVGELRRRRSEPHVAAVELDDVDAGHAADPAGVAGGDERPLRRAVPRADLLAAAAGADPAVGDDDEVVAQPLDDVELVAGEEHRGARV